MKVKMKGISTVLIFLALTWAGSSFPFLQAQEEKPVIILTNSNGEKAQYFRLMDSIFGSFSGLLPGTEYTMPVIRSDEKRISYSICRSDKRGIIPTIALWWDVGAEYTDSKVGRLDPAQLSLYTYRCELQREGQTVAEVPIRILSEEETGPIVYSSNERGDPLNMFAYQKENVYLTGRNFPAGADVRVYLVSDRYSWQTGDRLEPVSHKSQPVTLDNNQQDFTIMITSKTELSIGVYDFVVEYETVNGIIDRHDLIDSVYSAGFTISRLEPYPPPPQPPHVEDQLACQAPPQDPDTGTVIGAPNATYKDFFGENEEVWLSVNPAAGGHDYSNQNARLYVVYHRTEANWLDGTVLTDVSDGYETITVQPGCANYNYARIWSSPTVREEGYDVVVDFAPFGVYDRGQDIIDSLDARGFVVPTLWVCLESVSFNHNTGSNNSDAMNIRKNYAEDVPVPEWVKAQEAHPAAYIKNKTVTIKAVFSAASGVSSAKIRGAQQYGDLGDAVQTTVSFSGGTSGAVSFQVSADTPEEIKIFLQGWHWYCEDINNSGSPEVHLGDTKNIIYMALAQPQSPWTTSGPTEPWTEVLFRSCVWAWGETTVEGAADKITRELFLNVGGLYDTEGGYSFYWEGDYFCLSDFVANIPNIGVVNCLDMAGALVVYANAAGCGLSQKISNPFGYLNCIYAIGRGWTNNPFYDHPLVDPRPIVPEDWSIYDGRSRFGWHAFGGIGDNIFDACLTVDTDSNPDYGPPFTETWMIDEPWTGYKTKVVDDNPPTATGDPLTYPFEIQ